MAMLLGNHDPTSNVLDLERHGEIAGFKEAATFLDEFLLGRETHDNFLLPGRRVAMIYGREGSGKKSLLHRHGFLHSREMGLIMDFRIQYWNLAAFRDWVAARLIDMADIERGVGPDLGRGMNPPSTLTLVIGGVGIFNRMHGQEETCNALLHLLERAHAVKDGSKIRILLVCDESPAQFPKELLLQINAMHLLVPPEPMARLHMILDWIQRFDQLRQKTDDLHPLVWDLDYRRLIVDDDPTHIVHTIVVASSGCTPRELLTFMRRTFSGCAKPKFTGETVYNAAWIESLLYKIEGGATCITASNPATLNEPCFRYAGVGVGESVLGNTNKSCFVRDTPFVLNPNAGDNAAEPTKDEYDLATFAGAGGEVAGADGNTAKRPRVDLQPQSVTDAYNKRLAIQGEKLATAAREAKRNRSDINRK